MGSAFTFGRIRERRSGIDKSMILSEETDRTLEYRWVKD